MLCCAETNLMHKIKIHTRDDSEKDYKEGNDMDAKEEDEEVSKIDALTLQMCNGFFQPGCTVNTDNYYMSNTCAIRLKEKGVFCRGTIRSSRKFVPKSILFTHAEANELPRGTQRSAVNHDLNIIAIG
jgi:hypothetical protein